MLKLVFETSGYEVIEAASAAEAGRALAEGGQFDLVVTDMRMESDTSGYDVVAVAKSREQSPPAVILTAFPLLATDWRAAGADVVIPKPCKATTLLEVASRLIDRHRP